MLPPNRQRLSHESLLFLADQPKAVAAGQPCYLVVPAESEIKFRNALKKLGYGLSLS